MTPIGRQKKSPSTDGPTDKSSIRDDDTNNNDIQKTAHSGASRLYQPTRVTRQTMAVRTYMPNV